MGVFSSGILAGLAKVGVVVSIGALAAVMLLEPGAAAAQTQAVSIGSAALAIGDQVAVDLIATGIPEPGQGAWEVTISYDSSVVSVLQCGVPDGDFCDTASPDSVTVTGASAVGIVGDRELATIRFLCESEGESELSVELIIWGSAFPEDPVLDPQINNGMLTCESLGEETPLPSLPNTGTGSASQSADPSMVVALLLAALVTLGAGLALNLRQTP